MLGRLGLRPVCQDGSPPGGSTRAAQATVPLARQAAAAMRQADPTGQSAGRTSSGRSPAGMIGASARAIQHDDPLFRVP
jgi:hypothetical protein